MSQGIKFFQKKFLAAVDDKEKDVIVHSTCATDTKAMQVIISGLLYASFTNLSIIGHRL